VHKLSGGEKRRLLLLKVLVRSPNFLILDEPTNDLDIDTLNVLEQFLETFSGCLILVSHDRYFMDKLVDQLFIFEGNGVIRPYNGNYSDYRNEVAEREKLAESQKKAPKLAAAPTPVVEKKKLSFKEQKELEQVEKDIADLEKKKKELEAKLSLPSANPADLMEWSEKISALAKQMEEKTLRWMELSE
ncbi:MAG TPA: ATP-binding cassette domain-containing protein, partial [Cytophagales bacterium]|nr:ATP-binding cassette domain-containing protein [Cytophagales bacterium]